MSKENLHIVKIGGKLINDRSSLERFLIAFSEIMGPKILIHGGGRKASEISTAMGILPNIIDGRRITDVQTLEVVIMVYAGLINKTIVSLLQALNINAMGLTGADGGLIRSHKRITEKIEYGLVGDIDHIDLGLLSQLLEMGLIPVIAPITDDGQGQLLNTNADTIAARIAMAMTTRYRIQLSYCFEFDGVLKDAVKNENEVIPRLRKDDYFSMVNNKQIHSGMIPKLTNCFDAIDAGVSEVFICGIDNLQCHTNATQILR